MFSAVVNGFDSGPAVEYGVDCAIVINLFQNLVTDNAIRKEEIHDGKIWASVTMRYLCSIYPYWSAEVIRDILKDLVRQGVLIEGAHSHGYDGRDLWFAFADPSLWIREDLLERLDLTSQEGNTD